MSSSSTLTQQPSGTEVVRTTAVPPSGPVDAELTFFAPPVDGSVPYNYVEAPTVGPQRNYGADKKTVQLKDIRGRESAFALDVHGFQALSTPASPPSSTASASPPPDFSTTATIEATYYPRVRELLTTHLSGHPTRILLFDHTIRRARPDAPRAPVFRVHIDQTAQSAAERVRLHVTDGAEADALLKGRVRIVNVWRPLNGPVETNPLAVADSTTVPDSALVPVEHRYPNRTGETAGVQHDAKMGWWYWSGMANGENLLLQCYDSESGSRVPHTAFEDPRSTAESKPRESIEVRALVFG